MECDRYPENGPGVSSEAWACGVKRKLAGGVRLGSPGPGGVGAALLAPRAAPHAPHASHAPHAPRAGRRRAEPRPSPRAPLPRVVQDSQDAPFMNNMDEITFWIVTKRAPCLAGLAEPPRAPRSASPVPESKNKKRRLIVDNTSDTIERPNIFMNNTAQPEFEILSSEKSDTLISDVDFNIKNSSIQAKNKKRKNQKSSRTTLHKKNKVITSTPNVAVSLRRSLRRAQCNLNNNSHLDSSFEIFSKTAKNGIENPSESKCEQGSPSNLAAGDQSNKKNSTTIQKPSNGVLNGQFEDLSDVSGFTANYIKSTKINSKTPRKLRTKSSRNLKDSRHSTQKEEQSLIVSINKAVNTGGTLATVLNCSTDSSPNVINFVTTEKNPGSNKQQVDKSTSLLKFMDSKKGNKDVNTKKDTRNGILNLSFQSTSTTGSRYPKRHKVTTETTADNSEKTDPSKLSSKRTNHHSSKSAGQIGCSSETNVQSKTRSGRCLGLSKPAETSVFVVSNSTEQMSSEVTMNVASPVQELRDSSKKKRLSSKCGRRRKSLNKTGQSTRDSFREKSGFAACFSDSDDDKPLKPQKYLS